VSVARAKAQPVGSVAKKGSRGALPLDDETRSSNYALRLTEALDAISAAQSEAPVPRSKPSARVAKAAPARRAKAPATPPVEVKPGSVLEEAVPAVRQGGFAAWLSSLDKMPPIRLPIGPPISWRIGLPALVALMVLMALVGRPSAHADSPGVQLPAQQTYPVQHEAPLFTGNTVISTEATPVAVADPQPLGVQDSAGLGFDVIDIGVKLIAVLALAYGSLLLLRRLGVGSASAPRSAPGVVQGMRVIASLTLAPNRSVYAIRVPGGRALVVGATPNAVNLIADLGDISDEDTPEASSFFTVLRTKLQ
jgi:flagellar biogenesis protein FliO